MLADWWQEHSELDGLVDRLKTSLERGTAAASAIHEEFAEALEAHFATEEEVYFELVRRLRPDLAPRVAAAQQAHQFLRDQIEHIRDCLRDGDRVTAQRVLAELLEKFGEHERLEAQMVAELTSHSQTN